MNIVSSWSGGKDSVFACFLAMLEGHSVKGLLNLVSKEHQRCCFHGLPNDLIKTQAAAAGLPIYQREMSDDTVKYETEFKAALAELKTRGIEGVVFGDIYLDEHKDWVERVCAASGVVALEPLWNMNPEDVLCDFISRGFKAIIVSCKEELGVDFVGRELDETIIQELKDRNLCPCGENGEYHTLVVDGPLFKSRIQITKAAPVLKEGFWRHWFLDIKEYVVKSND